jgi:hypothetical protein
MPTLTADLVLTFGETTPDNAVPCREPFKFTITYTEESTKRVRIPAGSTDLLVNLDTVGDPKFVFIQALSNDVTVKLSDGTATDPAPIQLTEADGWIMICNPGGQSVDRVLLTTPVTPSEGSLVRIVSFE